MTAPLKYDEISMQEKFIMLEELWENMSHDAQNNGFTPNWHLDILANREENIKNSKSTFSDLEDAKERLQKLTL
ncbi:MAG: addiction module protein [Campylobacterota bacterium]|nr:addiction module protein [Campylobacterota bacterium]